MKSIIFLITILFPLFALALTAEDRLPDPAQEMRAHELFKQVRCVVCTGESINDSNADLAVDLRISIRDMIKDGKSDGDILAFITDRYGDSVLMKPPFNSNTYILWLAPAVIFLIGIIGLVRFFRRDKNTSS